jgi:DNA-binding MarR family transcriptional regulator
MLGVSREEVIAAVMQAVAAFQDSTDLVDEAAARRLGLNRTDLRCLGILIRAGAMTAGKLAAAAHLSPGATTTAVRDDVDRRRVTVEPTPHAHEVTGRVWGPIGKQSHDWLSRCSTPQLRAILDFLEEGQLLQSAHAVRIDADPAISGATKPI